MRKAARARIKIAVVVTIALLFCDIPLTTHAVTTQDKLNEALQQKNELEQRSQMIQIQANQSLKEVEAIRRSAYETRIIRHDMRHHLQTIYADISHGNYEHTLKYIEDTIAIVEAASVRRFCANELVNTVLSYYSSVMQQQGILLDFTVNTEETLPCSEQEFTSILSNGLENAMHAVSNLAKSKQIVTLQLKAENEKLFLSIENPYDTVPSFEDGIPVTEIEGHGLGTQSIRYITHRLNGNC